MLDFILILVVFLAGLALGKLVWQKTKIVEVAPTAKPKSGGTGKPTPKP